MIIFSIAFSASVFSDLVSPQLFDFKFVKSESIPENTVVYKTEKRKFHCQIPRSPDIMTTLTPRDDIDYSQYIYIPKCLYLNNGWWTYEFCNEIIRQLHLSNNIETDAYVLGKQNSNYKVQERSGQFAIIKVFDRGTTCDVNQKHRQVQVEFSCFLNNEKLKLNNIYEESTCLYKATVHVPELCAVEGFQKKTNTNDIICYYIDDQPPKIKEPVAKSESQDESPEMETTENLKSDGHLDLGKLSEIVNKIISQKDNIQMILMDDEKNIDLEKTINELLAENKKKKKTSEKKEEL
eukprot:NODE_237_length_13348_cov_0.297381.p3 type:complete len:294 gc:universal NODE_237_length_13348_cov_0.297381:356-1237(+)